MTKHLITNLLLFGITALLQPASAIFNTTENIRILADRSSKTEGSLPESPISLWTNHIVKLNIQGINDHATVDYKVYLKPHPSNQSKTITIFACQLFGYSPQQRLNPDWQENSSTIKLGVFYGKENTCHTVYGTATKQVSSNQFTAFTLNITKLVQLTKDQGFLTTSFSLITDNPKQQDILATKEHTNFSPELIVNTPSLFNGKRQTIQFESTGLQPDKYEQLFSNNFVFSSKTLWLKKERLRDNIFFTPHYQIPTTMARSDGKPFNLKCFKYRDIKQTNNFAHSSILHLEGLRENGDRLSTDFPYNGNWQIMQLKDWDNLVKVDFYSSKPPNVKWISTAALDDIKVTVPEPPPTKSFPLMTNLTAPSRYSSSFPFIDEMKRAEILTQSTDFEMKDRWNTQELYKVDFDFNGWPRSLKAKNDQPQKFNRISYLLFTHTEDWLKQWGIHPSRAAVPNQKFHVYFKGNGKLEYSGSATRTNESCGENCHVVLMEPQTKGLAIISITRTNPEDPIRDIQAIWSGGTCGGDIFNHYLKASDCPGGSGTFEPFTERRDKITTNPSLIFHPDFLKDLRNYDGFRFMNFAFVNKNVVFDETSIKQLRKAKATNEEIQKERERMVSKASEMEPYQLPRVNTGVWNFWKLNYPGSAWKPKGGVPIRAMTALGNTLKKDLWFTLPIRGSDALFQHYATVVKNNLYHDQKVIIELSNETWNPAEPFINQGTWATIKGRVLFGDLKMDATTAKLQWFGKRTADMCQIWKQVWGDQSNRIQCVAGSQAANPFVSEQVLECPSWRDHKQNTQPFGKKACGYNVDTLGIASYFGLYIGSAHNKPIVDNWLNEEDGGLSSLFNAISKGNSQLVTNPFNPIEDRGISALDLVTKEINKAKQVSQKYGIDIVSYEGGQHLVGVGQQLNNTRLTKLFLKANRSPKMKDIYRKYLDIWNNTSGNAMAIYTSASQWSKWGSWGVKEYQNQPFDQAPKYEAIMDFKCDHSN